MRQSSTILALVGALAGCGAPEPPASTGGTAEPVGPCGRGAVVVHTNYSSSNISLVAFDGRVLSPSFFSSATGELDGLSTPLSGDVLVPTSPHVGSEVVLIDRSPASVLTWVTVATGKARAQLALGDRKNPHDYLELDPTRAYVSRYEGDDLAIVDPSQPAVIGSIDLRPALSDEGTDYRPGPGRMIAAGGRVYVVLEAYGPKFVGSLPSHLVAIDPQADAISEVLALDGVHGCSGLALSPAEDELALGCSGTWLGTSEPDPATSFVVRVGLSGGLHEIARFAALAFGGAPFGFGIDYASEQALVAVRFGNESGRPDSLLEIDLDNGQGRELLTTEAFALGDARCAADCNVCFATDAARSVVHRFEVTEGHVGAATEIVADDVTGLPPLWLGRF
jgi:hypothetical protein